MSFSLHATSLGRQSCPVRPVLPGCGASARQPPANAVHYIHGPMTGSVQWKTHLEPTSSTTSSGQRPSLMSSACGHPTWWAAPRRATHSDAAANNTRCPAWQARMSNPIARRVVAPAGVEELFGKHVLITDHDDWPVAEVIAGYRSQSEAEFYRRTPQGPAHDHRAHQRPAQPLRDLRTGQVRTQELCHTPRRATAPSLTSKNAPQTSRSSETRANR